MALIKCNECGKEISDKAKVCPHCGFENRITFCPECNKKFAIIGIICSGIELVVKFIQLTNLISSGY